MFKIRRKTKKIVTLILAVGVLFSMLPALALSGDTSNADGSVTAPPHQVSVMSFNILDYEGDGVYDSPSRRFNYVIATIRAYLPDLIGIQEAGVAQSSNGNFDWPTELARELGDVYDCRTLTDDNPSRQMKIGNGLIIFWKKNRFSRIDSGAVQYQNINYTSPYGISADDTSRDFQYVKLYDSTYKTYLYMFNTHLSINSKKYSDDDINRAAGKTFRTKEAAQLSAKMMELAEHYPCFATGDYNCNLRTSDLENADAYDAATNAYVSQLGKMSIGTPFMTSSLVARYNYPDGDHVVANQTNDLFNSIIDHCFVNTNYTEVITRRVIYRDVNGWQATDHRAVMSYMNYRAKASYNEEATYDAVAETLTATTDQPTYALSVTPVTNKFSYAVYNAAGKRVTGPLQLTAYANRFTIRFYNSTAAYNANTVYSNVYLTVYYPEGLKEPGTLTCEGALNTYCADDAFYIVLKSDISSIRPAVTGGDLFADKNCHTALSLPVAVTPGAKTYYVRLNGVVYPLNILQASIATESGVLYVDGSLAEATGRAAYADSDGVRLVTVGENGFSTIKAAVAAAPNGAEIYIAPGTYKEVVSSDAGKDLKFYGNNRDISPITKNGNIWSLSALRRPETIIEGQLSYSHSGNTGFITVKGITFTGSTAYGPIYYNGNSTSKTVTIDIERNILAGTSTNTTNGSELHFNNAAHKNGVIRDNYFGPTSDHPCYTQRSITMRNPDGIVIDNNYFFSTNNMYLTAEVSNNSLTPGNFNITLSYNRFEKCEQIYAYFYNVTATTSGHAKFLYNDFIRCGYTIGVPLCIYLQQPTAAGAQAPEFSNCSLDITGNRFISCKYALSFSRSQAGALGNLTDMRIDVHQNRFVSTNQFSYSRTIYVAVYADTIPTLNVECPNWDMSYNYFYSEQTSSHDPAAFTQVLETNSLPRVRFTQNPYYLDEDLTILSSADPVNVLNGVTATGGTFPYDGTPKTITVSAPEGAIVSYSTDGVNYSSVAPTLTDAGSLTVYYMAEKTGYRPVTGSAVVTVEPNLPTGISLPDQSVAYNSEGSPVQVNGLQTGDRVTFRCNGTEYADLPIFTELGTCTVTATVRRAGYSPLSVSGSITVLPGMLSGVMIRDTTVAYDGGEHAPEIAGTQSGDVLLYSVNGGEFLDHSTARDVGNYTVQVRISRRLYEMLTLSAALTIKSTAITGVTAIPYEGISDGTAHTAAVSGTLPGDVIAWSADGETYGSDTLSFTDPGYYPVWIKVSRTNCSDLVLQSAVLLNEAQPDLLIPALLADRGETLRVTLAEGPAMARQDIKVLDITVKYGDALYDHLNGGTDETLSVLCLRRSEMGIKRLQTVYMTDLPKDTKNAAVFLTYEADGVTYTRVSLL